MKDALCAMRCAVCERQGWIKVKENRFSAKKHGKDITSFFSHFKA